MYKYCCFGINWELGEATSFTGKNFEKFIDLLFDNSDSFSLSNSRWFNANNNILQIELEPYLIKKYNTLKWFGYDYSQAPCEDEKYLIRVNMYEANDYTKKILLSHIDDIFLNRLVNGELIDDDLSLEDLNFFINNTLVLGTVSHAMKAILYNNNDSFDELLGDIGNWEKGKENEKITIPSLLNQNDM